MLSYKHIINNYITNNITNNIKFKLYNTLIIDNIL